MRDPECDVIVVGGGPAGSLLSILLGRAGYLVQLYEGSQFPREKPCGEGLLPPGVEVLKESRTLDFVGGRRILGVQYHVGDDSFRAGFGRDQYGARRFGLGQRRLHLDHALWNIASGTRGVGVRQQCRVTGPLLEGGKVKGVFADGGVHRARLVVAADGACSTMRRKLGMERAIKPNRVGIRRHFSLPRGRLCLDDIQIFMRKGYELYVTPLPDDEVVVAALAHGVAAGPNLRAAFEGWQRREPLLRRWLLEASPCSEVMGRAPLLKCTRGALPDGLILLGDACHSVDPVTAGGMSLALSAAASLSLRIPAVLSGSRSAKAAFVRHQASSVRIHEWLGVALRFLSQSPLAARGAKSLVEAHPETMDALLGLATLPTVG